LLTWISDAGSTPAASTIKLFAIDVLRDPRTVQFTSVSQTSLSFHGTYTPDAGGLLHFGVFELDLDAGELRKAGSRIRVQKQPFEILRILVQRPGEVVTREELRTEIWSADTFVDFDNSLNTSINKLRDVLGDTSSSPRFIETIPRSYRFIAPVRGRELPAPPLRPESGSEARS
jgi:DNA-binding winged helix-turn-helix (wHTH) protein